jgi:hypothetical protein
MVMYKSSLPEQEQDLAAEPQLKEAPATVEICPCADVASRLPDRCAERQPFG